MIQQFYLIFHYKKFDNKRQTNLIDLTRKR